MSVNLFDLDLTNEQHAKPKGAGAPGPWNLMAGRKGVGRPRWRIGATGMMLRLDVRQAIGLRK
jgi:hypothetical protein